MSRLDQIANRLQRWKARRSVNDGACAEVALVNGQVAVRDSKGPCSFWLGNSLALIRSDLGAVKV